MKMFFAIRQQLVGRGGDLVSLLGLLFFFIYMIQHFFWPEDIWISRMMIGSTIGLWAIGFVGFWTSPILAALIGRRWKIAKSYGLFWIFGPGFIGFFALLFIMGTAQGDFGWNHWLMMASIIIPVFQRQVTYGPSFLDAFGAGLLFFFSVFMSFPIGWIIQKTAPVLHQTHIDHMAIVMTDYPDGWKLFYGAFVFMPLWTMISLYFIWKPRKKMDWVQMEQTLKP